jgi:hypothetical protein
VTYQERCDTCGAEVVDGDEWEDDNKRLTARVKELDEEVQNHIRFISEQDALLTDMKKAGDAMKRKILGMYVPHVGTPHVVEKWDEVCKRMDNNKEEAQ